MKGVYPTEKVDPEASLPHRHHIGGILVYTQKGTG